VGLGTFRPSKDETFTALGAFTVGMVEVSPEPWRPWRASGGGDGGVIAIGTQRLRSSKVAALHGGVLNPLPGTVFVKLVDPAGFVSRWWRVCSRTFHLPRQYHLLLDW